MKATQQEERDKALKRLSMYLAPGKPVYTINDSVARSGMSARLKVYIVGPADEIIDISYYVAKVCGYTLKNGAVKVDGCGLDRGHALVYDLGCVLWPDGTPEPHSSRNGEPDSSGGYALRHSWL